MAQCSDNRLDHTPRRRHCLPVITNSGDSTQNADSDHSDDEINDELFELKKVHIKTRIAHRHVVPIQSPISALAMHISKTIIADAKQSKQSTSKATLFLVLDIHTFFCD